MIFGMINYQQSWGNVKQLFNGHVMQYQFQCKKGDCEIMVIYGHFVVFLPTVLKPKLISQEIWWRCEKIVEYCFVLWYWRHMLLQYKILTEKSRLCDAIVQAKLLKRVLNALKRLLKQNYGPKKSKQRYGDHHCSRKVRSETEFEL